MSNMIKDGTGRGYLTAVDSRGDMHVHSRTLNAAAAASRAGKAYSIVVYRVPVTATGGRIFWIDFSEQRNQLIIDSLMFGWNGGNTNHNRCALVDFVIGDTAPTTNILPAVIANFNMSSANTFSHTAYQWDGVGNGMVGHTPGISVSQHIIGQGYSNMDSKGTIIIASGLKLSINVQGEEAGLFSLQMLGYLLDPDKDYFPTS